MADSADQLATVGELSTWMGMEFDEVDTGRAEYILRVTSGWARQLAGKLWPSRSDPAFPITVHGIVLAAARREMENPRRVLMDTKGPESASYNRLNYPPGFFTEPEEKFLQRFQVGSGGVAGLFTMTTKRDDWDFTLGYIRTMGVDKPLPYFNPGDPGWAESEHL